MTDTPAPHDERDDPSNWEHPELVDRFKIHWRCDCVPSLGPPHCHVCDVNGTPVEWDDDFHRPRVQPSVEDVARVAFDSCVEGGMTYVHCKTHGGVFKPDSDSCEIVMHRAEKVHALFTTAPTVADVREQVAREIEAFGENSCICAYGDYGPPAIAVEDAAHVARGKE